MDSSDDDQSPPPLANDPDAASIQFSDVVDFGTVPNWANYAVLGPEMLRFRIEGLIAQVSTALSVPRYESTALLLRFRGQLKDLIDAWRSDDGEIREKFTSLTQPEPEFGRDDALIRSFVEHKASIRWCPNPDCQHAVEALNCAVSDVSCACSNAFCWNCGGEAHRPVDCTTIKKWASEISPETQSMNQILIWFKHCPKCMQPIEFDSDYDSVSPARFVLCPPPCNYSFCLSCLGSWDFHDVNGDCLNPINEIVQKSAAKVTAALRYFRFLERWEAYEASEERAEAALKKVIMEVDIDFLVGAWVQIRNCRRLLKWLHVSLYFLQGDDKCNKRRDKLWRTEAEKALWKLHNQVKKWNPEMLEGSEGSEEFPKFRRKVIQLTINAKCCFENLVYAIQNQTVRVNG